MAFFRKHQQEDKPSVPQEFLDLRAAIEKARLPEHVHPAAHKELEKLEKTDPSLPEYTIGLTYLDYILSLPWNRYTDDNLDLKRAAQILERQHYGLGHAKQRVLEFLAVRTLRSNRKFRILVVDDEEMARANMEHVIRKEGYEVRTAANGLEALRHLQDEPFDLVITDLKMEKLDGIELLQSAKQSPTPPEIILVTGHATVDSAVDAFAKGAAYYLTKPYKLDELRSAVHRILEKKRHAQFTRGPILCFAGPPGTGKTSIGQAIAEAMERKFARISLAGLRDEAELRGHRRTYVGAMPGRIMSEIKNLGLKNPVLMLDEIDKIGQDFKGDPASVLLEILDPEQNRSFRDHYLDVAFDLSAVMFIATANVVENLPSALLDRLEVIQFPGYTETEKSRIAQQFLIPRQLIDCGLSDHEVRFEDEAVAAIIRDYTREAGLRNLEREIANVCRKLAFLHLQQGDQGGSVTVDSKIVASFLGPRKYRHEIAESANRVGITTGLVWTEFGGEIVFVEAARMRGSQQVILTGSLGDVLRESAQTALSYVRSHAESLGIDPEFFHSSDIHIHIPAGAIPKDGPSAGITICMALISLLTSRPARRDAAMTGEITLSGRILPVSGIREKVLAAQRAGVKTIVFPGKNRMDIECLSEESTKGLEIVLAEEIEEIVNLVIPARVADF
ncbi:MAG: endopeptidase La [Desulfomonile tiedjei]|uniref:endopeptidase La n=1 Tax=Desulfomonile tiedjei TaxID=2358 RepID=A0A9D6UYP4_9BACT|nr:endopeptidase La [Desulfomonile tiedjei]